MNVVKAVLLGLLRAFTGCMPLSGSAHLLVLEKLSGMALSGEDMAAFMMALHAGVAAALLIGCIQPIFAMLRHPAKGELKWVLVASLPLAGVCLLIRAVHWESTLRQSALTLLPYALLFTAVVLFLSSRIAKNRRMAKTQHDRPTFGVALSAGLMQCLGVFTGVSLSGMALSGTLCSGLKSKKAADFVYLLFLPALLICCLPKGIELAGNGALKAAIDGHGAVMLAGFLSSALTGIAAVKLTQLMIRREKTAWFSVYLALFAIVTIVLSFAGKM